MRLKLKKYFILKLILILVLLFIVVKQLFLKKFKHFTNELNIVREKYDIDCKKIFEMDSNEIEKSKNFLKNKNLEPIKDYEFIFDKSKCDFFRKKRNYNRFETENDSDFALAFSILTYNDAEQFERLLNVIYRPQNVYCIHVDSKSSSLFKQAIKSIVDCFDNVFIASNLENIVYAHYSRLQADINCLKDLNQPKYKWNYFLNMASTEFPLRTNSELVRILKMYNGSNEIEIIKAINPKRFKFKSKINPNTNILYVSNETKTEAPHGFKIVKGYAYCVLSRLFVDYVVKDEKSKDLLEWAKDTWSPDEWYWATLQYNTQFYNKSGFVDEPEKDRINTIARFAGWGGEYNCKGKWRNGVCVFSIEDLPEMIMRPHFIVNKFLLNYDPISYQCMEEWYNQRVLLNSKTSLNMFFYCKFLNSHSSLAKCPKIF